MSNSLFSLSIQGGAIPEWVQLVPAGTFCSTDGRGPWHCSDEAALINVSMAAGRIPIDVNHSTDLAAPMGGESPAAGWIVQMQSRPDGIWGRVEWTPLGQRLLGERAYRNISPTLSYSGETGVIFRILRASLTNNPALPQLMALNSVQSGRGQTERVGLTDLDRQICRHMGVDPQALLAHRTLRSAPGLTGVDVALCQSSGIDPAMLSARCKTAGTPAESFGLLQQELQIARMMEVSPMEVHAAKWLRETDNATRRSVYGLTPAEQRLCDILRIDFLTYSQAKKADPENDPILRSLDDVTISKLKRLYSGEDLRKAGVEYAYRNTFCRGESPYPVTWESNMNFEPETMTNLRRLLLPVDEAKAIIADLASQIETARAAASRLDIRISDVDSQIAALPTSRIQADAHRVASLIAGADVPLPDKKDVEAAAQRQRHLAAQQQQLVDDAAAVRAHIGDLERRHYRATKQHDQAELALLQALGEASYEVFRTAAVNLVSSQIPPLYSIADRLAIKAGARPLWWFDIVNSFAVGWTVPADPLPGHPGPIIGRLVQAWPRVHPAFEDKLISGEPSHPPEIVDGLIAFIRAYEAPAPVHSDEAAGANGAAPAFEDAALTSEPVAA
jgi:hypothetical protein